ncbi:MAG TPA: EAL domain-containing protein [Acidimicrobiales bacterium]
MKFARPVARRDRSLSAVAASIVDGMRDGLAIHDAKGELVEWNGAAAQITGWNTIEEAAPRFPPDVGDGLVDLGGGLWVDVRHVRVPARGGAVTVTLFTDARHTVELHEAYASLENVATTDPLTGLPNRVLAEDRLRLSVHLARRDARPVGLLFVDLDRFKLVNDTLGHSAGDSVLREVASRLRRAIRDSDTAARVGGDEFVVILHTITHAADAERVGREILAGFESPFLLGDQEVYLAASVGVAVFPDHADDAGALLQAADLANARAKSEGGNAFRSYAPVMSEHMRERIVVGAELHRALARDELEVHYQPQVDIDTATVVGCEALVRWRHPERGLVAPAVFLSVAEENGSIVEIDRLVATTACRQLRAWDDAGLKLPMVSVNFSARTFLTENVVDLVTDALAASGIDPGRLEVEVSEHVVADQEGAGRKMAELKELGVQIAIDDFGIGYSSLGHLKRFRFDTIKLDRSFVADVTGQPSPADIAVLRAVVTMASDLGLRCVAEGVETAAQRKVLRFLRCHLVQGYLYGVPAPAGEIPALLAAVSPRIALSAG